MNDDRIDKLLGEVVFQFSRSSGPGGQLVNKTESRVEIRFDISESKVLTEKEKDRIFSKLSNRINQESVLTLNCQDSRSQLHNRKIVIDRFVKLIQQALFVSKRRIPTRPSRGSIEKRIEHKKKLAEKKKYRKKVSW